MTDERLDAAHVKTVRFFMLLFVVSKESRADGLGLNGVAGRRPRPVGLEILRTLLRV